MDKSYILTPDKQLREVNIGDTVSVDGIGKRGKVINILDDRVEVMESEHSVFQVKTVKLNNGSDMNA